MARPSAEGRGEPAASGPFDPRVIRRIASAVPLDVLVCTEPELAVEALPLFREVHLLDPAAGPNGDDSDDGPAIHGDPVSEVLVRLGTELGDARALFAISAEHDLAPLRRLGPRSVLLSDAGSPQLERDFPPPGSEHELSRLGPGLLAGPPGLAAVLEPLFRQRGRNGDGGAPAAADEQDGELEQALELVARLRDRNARLERRIADLRSRRVGLAGGGPIGRIFHRLRWLRLRIRPIVGVRLGLLWNHRPKQLRVEPAERRVEPPADAPSISIVVPSYNQGEFIGRTLDSVLDQDYPKLELIVQDGGSLDGTLAELEPYRDRLTHLSSEPDGGQADAINRGLARSSGEVMAWLNSDDVLLPGSLAYVGRYFAEHPEVDVVYGHRVLIDSDDREIGRWVMPPHDDAVLSWADYVPQETMFWRREIWERAGGELTEGFRFALDWDLLVRMRDAGARTVRLPRFLGAFRVHEEQKSTAQVLTIGSGEMDRMRRRIHGRAVSRREIRRAIRPYLRRHALLDKAYRLRLVRYR